MRANASAGPPGANPTRIFTGRSGNDCASAAPLAIPSSDARSRTMPHSSASPCRGPITRCRADPEPACPHRSPCTWLPRPPLSCGRARALPPARARGMKHTPVSSANTISPGATRTPATSISPLISTVSMRHFPVTGRDFGRPHRVADAARMRDVADAAEYDRTGLALTLAGLRGDAAHVRDSRHAVDHDDIAGSARLCASNSAILLTCRRAVS